MVKKIYIELTADEMEILEKAEQIMSAVARETKSSYDASICISEDDEHVIMNLAAAGSQVMNYSSAFYIMD